MDLAEWLANRDGIGHRDAARLAGFGQREQARRIASGELRVVRRSWLALPTADPELVGAATAGARLTCLSLARRRGWWIPEGFVFDRHLSVKPHGRSPSVEERTVIHWSQSIAPASPFTLVESIEDTLGHIAACVSEEAALIIWESAIRAENISVDALRNVRWKSRAARRCAEEVDGLSDSGLETIAVTRLSRWGIPIRQQAVLARKPVDLLIGERLVVQIDGFAHHSSSAQRSRDLAHDAELRLRGYTVLRFTYSQVVHEWPAVERTIARAIAAGAHLAA